MRHPQGIILAAVLTGLLVLTACSSPEPDPDLTEPDPDLTEPDDEEPDAEAPDASEPREDADGQRFPDVVAAELDTTGDTWRLSATLSSPYDTPERYADAFRAVTPDGEELGVRVLLHDHAGEQPFTRSLTDLQIPGDVDTVVVEGRDLEHGWGGDTITLEVPRDG